MGEFFESEKLFNKVEKLRIEKGWTSYALAKRANISPSALKGWEKDKSSPTLYLLESICTAFGIHVVNLFMDNDELMYLPKEQKDLISHWIRLTDDEKNALLLLLNSIHKE